MNGKYIQLKNICKSYSENSVEKIEVLKDFNLDVAKEEIISLYGPNGCGKTTILSIIAKLLDSDKGEVLINDKKPSAGDVGCLFQDYSASLFPWFTCLENIAFSYRIKGFSKTERLEKVEKFLSELSVELSLSKYPYQLSGGQQQLVALARALCNSPSALVMDEPFSSLDATVREKVRAEAIDIIRQLKLTAVLVSHNLEDCIITSDRIVFLSHLPTSIYTIEKVPPEIKRKSEKIYSDQFAKYLNKYRKIAFEAQTK